MSRHIMMLYLEDLDTETVSIALVTESIASDSWHVLVASTVSVESKGLCPVNEAANVLATGSIECYMM